MDAKDILNNTDPQEIRNILRRLKVLSSFNRAVPNVVITQAPGQFPSSFDGTLVNQPLRMVITDANSVITTDPTLEYQPRTYAVGAQISTGTVNANNASGVQIAGLTIGQWYAVDGAGGPWKTNPSQPNSYNFNLSLDGVSFSGNVGLYGFDSTFYTSAPGFAAFAEAIDSNYGRVYFQASATSIWFRCHDTGIYTDNTGTLGYIFRFATAESSIILNDVEYTEVKLPRAINNADQKASPDAPDRFPYLNSTTNLLAWLSWTSLQALLGGAIFSDAEGQPSDVTSGASADGTSVYPARRDHVHHVDVGQYRQFVWADDGAGSWAFVSAGGEPVLHLEDLE